MNDRIVTSAMAAVWAAAAVLLIHGALYHADGTLRAIGTVNGFELVIGFISLIVVISWVVFMGKLRLKGGD